MRIADNSKIYENESTVSKSLLLKVIDKPLSDLEKENIFVFPPTINDTNDLAREQKIMERKGSSLYTGNIMGCIGNQEEHLMIYSRFDQVNKKDYFFYYMLKRVMNLNLIDLEVSFKNKQGFLNLMFYLFPKYLNEAIRKGVYKEYQTFKYNDLNIAGTIDVKRHLKMNVPFTGKVAYQTREYSFENQVIYLIRYTIEQLKKGKETIKILNMDSNTRASVQAIEGASKNYRKCDIKKVIYNNKQRKVCHGYFYEYRNLQKLCLAILEYETGVFMEKSDQQIFGVLFDGAWLFEEYVHLLIKDQFIHPENRSQLNGQRLFEEENDQIYPDFISKNLKETIVADAKYKPATNIKHLDYLQLLAYMYRFDSKLGYYLYPESNNCKSRQELTVSQGIFYQEIIAKQKRDLKIKLIKQGLMIPSSAQTFEEFEKSMSDSEKMFILSFSVGELPNIENLDK
ncbi:hypothetical protein [uncultured Enterococcus sp.]|uniref:5-methylcytosine restriction system specificity protein McrC n=1 Tax=uncultured Enterococcus sp. TaxID=167972 RepID=UPI002AA7A662|nr:hypothetical protein [uncultured Enterococcus sp.]